MTTDTPASLTSPLTASHRTILLKHARSTVVLGVLPSARLAEIKRDLLAALASRGITAFPGSSPAIPLPDDPGALEFGVLVDRKDASRGWKLLREDEQNGNEADAAAAAREGEDGSEGEDEEAAAIDNIPVPSVPLVR
ncbi:hypothetical protein DV735_g2146, partial [Chaetothyriales sp. CBS 134920]